MELITKGYRLSRNLIELLEKYDNVAFAVAWASFDTDVFNVVRQVKAKIHRAVIGTHFYQTHPSVVDEFVNFDQVRFVFQPQGVFHPKVYCFWNTSDWELVIGSANLTAGALSKNSEVMLRIESNETSGPELKNQVLGQIDEYWRVGDTATRESATAYRALWKTQRARLRRISGTYSKSSKGKAPVHTSIMTKSWPEFLQEIRRDETIGHLERSELLEAVRIAFNEHQHFNEMELGLRKTIAGLPNNYNDHWAWFGSMKGAGYFHQAVNNNDANLSHALDHIPLQGAISRDCYDAYVGDFIRAFPNGRDGVGVASRLLALKRPDTFVCFDSKNRDRLCADFAIKKSSMNYERYWEDVVDRITDSVWWNSSRPRDVQDRMIWNARAAMLDAIFYEP